MNYVCLCFVRFEHFCRPVNEIHFKMAFAGWKIVRSTAV